MSSTDYERRIREAFAPLFAAAYRPKHRADVDEPDTYPSEAEAARAETHHGRHRKGLVVVK